jgi:hypothetical protein
MTKSQLSTQPHRGLGYIDRVQASPSLLSPAMIVAGVRCISLVLLFGASQSCADDHDGRPARDAGRQVDGAATGTSDAGWLPTQCHSVQSPLLNPACLQGLADACSAHSNERDCSAQGLLNINDYEFRCGWARVITFAQPQACSGASTSARCVAGFQDNTQGCGDPCASLSTPNPWNTFASTTSGELIENPCGERQARLYTVQSDTCFGPQAAAVCRCAAAACMSP